MKIDEPKDAAEKFLVMVKADFELFSYGTARSDPRTNEGMTLFPLFSDNREELIYLGPSYEGIPREKADTDLRKFNYFIETPEEMYSYVNQGVNELKSAYTPGTKGLFLSVNVKISEPRIRKNP